MNANEVLTLVDAAIIDTPIEGRAHVLALVAIAEALLDCRDELGKCAAALEALERLS